MTSKISVYKYLHILYTYIWYLHHISGDIDWSKCIRFSAYGGLFVAPSLYAWCRFANSLFPALTLRTAIIKAAVEQLTYIPFITAAFFFCQTFMETLSVSEACDEVGRKFLPTLKVSVCYWQSVSSINFAFVPERNRIVFSSAASLVYTTFLAYMKQTTDEQPMTSKKLWGCIAFAESNSNVFFIWICTKLIYKDLYLRLELQKHEFIFLMTKYK